MYDDIQQNRESVRPVPTNLESTLDREILSLSLSLSLSPSHRVCMIVFSKVYCDRVYFCAPSGLRQGQVPPPPPPAAPLPSPRGLMPLRTPQVHELRTSALQAPQYERFTNAGRRSYERRKNLR